jgi:ATP-dependent DNA helicase RecQ
MASWEGVDRDLFESLRQRRLELAKLRGLAPYLIFSDATLRELARIRPSTLERMHRVHGIGSAKLEEFGPEFLDLIQRHCRATGSKQDVAAQALPKRSPPPASSPTRRPNLERDQAFALFRKGCSVSEVVEKVGRARGTIYSYLEKFIEEAKPSRINRWIDDATYALIARAAATEGLERLRPIFVALDEKVPYDDIRVVVAHLRTRTDGPPWSV